MVSKEEIEEMFEIILGDEKLRNRLAEIIIDSIDHNLHLKNDLVKMVSREMAR